MIAFCRQLAWFYGEETGAKNPRGTRTLVCSVESQLDACSPWAASVGMSARPRGRPGTHSCVGHIGRPGRHPVFHEMSRAEGPSQQATKEDGLSYLFCGG